MRDLAHVFAIGPNERRASDVIHVKLVCINITSDVAVLYENTLIYGTDVTRIPIDFFLSLFLFSTKHIS